MHHSWVVLLGSLCFIGVGVWEFFKLKGIPERLGTAGVVGLAMLLGFMSALDLAFGTGFGMEDLSDREFRVLFVLVFVLGMSAGGVVMLIERTPRAMKSASRTVANVSKAARAHAETQAEQEDYIYHQISDEIERGSLDRATWLKAYERVNGDEQRAKAEYIRLRKKKLLNQS